MNRRGFTLISVMIAVVILAVGVLTRRPEQAVDHLVHRAVATVDDDHVDTVPPRGLRDLDGVAPVVGVLDGELDPAFQGMRQQVARRGGRRGGVRVDDQDGAHEA